MWLPTAPGSARRSRPYQADIVRQVAPNASICAIGAGFDEIREAVQIGGYSRGCDRWLTAVCSVHSRVSAVTGIWSVTVPAPGSGCCVRGAGQHVAGPMGTVTVAARADGEETSKVTQVGPVTMTPPVKPVKRGPHTGSRTMLRDAARRSWPERALNSAPMRDGEPYTSRALAGRVMETVAKGAADAETARNAL